MVRGRSCAVGGFARAVGSHDQAGRSGRTRSVSRGQGRKRGRRTADPYGPNPERALDQVHGLRLPQCQPLWPLPLSAIAEPRIGSLRASRGLVRVPGPAAEDPAPVHGPRPVAGSAAQQFAEPFRGPTRLSHRAAAAALVSGRDPLRGASPWHPHRSGGGAQFMTHVLDGDSYRTRHHDNDSCH